MTELIRENDRHLPQKSYNWNFETLPHQTHKRDNGKQKITLLFSEIIVKHYFYFNAKFRMCLLICICILSAQKLGLGLAES